MNEILAEIRATRDALMRECGGDLARFGDLRRAGETRWASAGHPVVSFEGQSPLEFVRLGSATIPRNSPNQSS